MHDGEKLALHSYSNSISKFFMLQLCMFHNITQREQAYRWNAFNGILGVWKHWNIHGGNFTTMNFVHGDSCAGNLERQTNVKLVSFILPKIWFLGRRLSSQVELSNEITLLDGLKTQKRKNVTISLKLDCQKIPDITQHSALSTQSLSMKGGWFWDAEHPRMPHHSSVQFSSSKKGRLN